MHIVDREDGLLTAAILKIRELRGVGLRELARRSGVGLATLARLEAGQADVKLSTLERIAQGLGVPLAALFSGEVDAPPVPEEITGLEIFAWSGVEKVAGTTFVVVWEPSRELGRVYAATSNRPVVELIHDAIGYDLEELPAELVERTPFLRRWGAGPFGTNPPPAELFAVVARDAELELMPLAGKEEVREVWGKKAPPERL